MLVLSLSSQALASSPADVINNFAFNAADLLSKTESSYFFSPFSIISAFSMAYAGASGSTAKEIEHSLGFSWGLHSELGEFIRSITQTGQVSTANRVWLATDLELLNNYQDTLYLYYQARPSQLDFRNDTEHSRQLINKWASDNTNGKIPTLLDSLDPSTRMLLTNAVYFNAEWLCKFDRNDTSPEPFSDNGKISQVPMMKQYDKFSYGEFDGVKVIRLQYKGRALSMIAVLPPEGQAFTLDAQTLSRWMKSLRTYKVDLWLPKFRAEKSYTLSDMFNALGVSEAFTDKADFSGISKSEQLKIDEVIHKTFIDVDEEKTEAAAVTAIGLVGATAMPPQYPTAEFHADRPFTYFITDDRTGTILFMGRQTF